MSAAESDFPLDPLNEIPSWLGYAQRVFDVQVARWDTQTCGGGIHWLFSPDGVSSQRYNYKNSITHGVLFQLAARLARYTGNQTYIDWADRTWDWTTSVKLITPDFRVYDGVTSTDGCRDVVPLQWSYNAAVFLYGSAVMSNQVSILHNQQFESCLPGLPWLTILCLRQMPIHNGRTSRRTCSPVWPTPSSHRIPIAVREPHRMYWSKWRANPTVAASMTSGASRV